MSVFCSVHWHLLIHLRTAEMLTSVCSFLVVFGKLLSFYFLLLFDKSLFATQYFIPFLSCIVPLCMNTALLKRVLLLAVHYSTWVCWCRNWMLASLGIGFDFILLLCTSILLSTIRHLLPIISFRLLAKYSRWEGYWSSTVISDRYVDFPPINR